MVTAKLVRKIHEIDASGISVGRLASNIANLLRGKNKATYLPYKDEGDFVSISNVRKMKITGRKLDQKTYYHPTEYLGNLKEEPMKRLMEKNPKKVLYLAVKRMLPKNKLARQQLKRLKIKD